MIVRINTTLGYLNAEQRIAVAASTIEAMIAVATPYAFHTACCKYTPYPGAFPFASRFWCLFLEFRPSKYLRMSSWMPIEFSKP